MKRERAFVENRRKRILEQIKETPGIRVDELAEMFEVSAITIRRDLQYLEDQKKLVRFYGGATINEQNADQDMDEVQLYRMLIAKYAATLVEDGDSLFINTSSNALQMLQYVTSKNVTVITNNGRAVYGEQSPGVNVILTGGELRYPKEAMVGEFAERNLQKVYAKKAFVGCSGISVECGVTTEIANEVNLNELMLRRATKTAYILADHTKIGHNSSFRTCRIERVTHLITDEKAPADIIGAMREMGIHVHQVRKDDAFPVEERG
ncbi:MAG: DeoR/GlpR family DNA-binding transcription regulator [Eubacteriales bacterium]|nr:DeoR/GlpR family DNA-binding transcription regulator [Eubacteriales bacterium]